MRAEMGKDPTRAPPSQLNLPPGFRFYPTDEELVVHYLCKKASCQPFPIPIIAEIELYKFDPWDLPERALFGEKEWYFFSPRDRKYPNGSRPNRAAGTGYWKATGTDKPISTLGGSKKVGVKKALVFYRGKAPKGVKTNWIMYEYRLADGAGTARSSSAKRKESLRLDDWVLCRIYKKSSSDAAQAKAGNSIAEVKVEQSESSCLDDVLATLSELHDPLQKESVWEEADDTQMETAGTVRVDGHVVDGEAASQYSAPGTRGEASDLRAYTMKELAGMARGEGEGSNGRGGEERSSAELVDASRQNSPLESSTSLLREEEDMAEESTFNSLAGFPLTRLLLNTSNVNFSGAQYYGLDMGLPSPGSMLAAGVSFGGSLIEPDHHFFQPSHLGWDAGRINFPS